MNTALPMTAKTQNTQSTQPVQKIQQIQQIQHTQHQHPNQDAPHQNKELCQLDKMAKADKTNTVDKTSKTNEAHKAIVLTPPASAASPLQPSPEIRILRIKEVAKKLSMGQSTIYDWINKKSPRYDKTFPKPIKLSSKSIGWLSTEIDAWLLAKVEQTRGTDFG